MTSSVWYPKKRLGQSFLCDPNVVRKIVAAAQLKPDEVVVEIGPGRGAITMEVAKLVRSLIAVEVDSHLAGLLRENFPPGKQVEILEGDFLKFDLSTAANRHGVDKVKVLGNIPYSISGPILFHLLSNRNKITQAILMMQKEVAERITATPGTKAYGIPSVLLSTYACVKKLFHVPASCFYPRPQVMSTVLRIEFLHQPVEPISDETFFCSFVRAAFSHRRKTLLNNLLSHYGSSVQVWELEGMLSRLGFDLRIRAEDLTPRDFIQLSNTIALFR